MRIVYLLSYFELVGGQEYYLARNQAKQGHEVIIIAADRHYPVPKIRERYAMEGIPEQFADLRPGKSRFDGLTIYRIPTVLNYQDFFLVRGVKELIAELKPDVVFGHEPRTMVPVLGAKYKRQFGYVYFLDSHDFFHAVQNHAWWQRFLRYAEYFWWRRWFVDYAYRQADRIYAVAGECRKFMERTHHLPASRITDLPLGVDTDFFKPDATARERVRASLACAPGDVVLTFAGYMFRRKALESLIDIVASANDVPLRLVFAGEGPADYLAELRERARTAGVADRVTFTGFVGRKQLNEIFSASDIGVWPGNNSLVILEAMANELPVVMADMQLAHLVKHDNGIAVPYADVPALEAAIRTLANDATLRQRYGQAGAKAAREQYSYERLAREVTGHMEEAVRARK